MIELLRKAPARFRKSLSYCRDGLVAVFRKEESFRLETIAFVVLLAVLLPAPWPAWKKTAMLAGYLLIPLVELLNSAIEHVCDLVSREHSPLIKTAKDAGALAVLFAIAINALLLATLLLL